MRLAYFICSLNFAYRFTSIIGCYSFAIALGLLMIDAVTFLICNKTQLFAIRRDAIKHKWQGEKVFGPEHDREVSVYRTLKEITEKNLLRDAVHAALFALLFLMSIA